jgi:hypothetical protein
MRLNFSHSFILFKLERMLKIDCIRGLQRVCMSNWTKGKTKRSEVERATNTLSHVRCFSVCVFGHEGFRVTNKSTTIFTWSRWAWFWDPTFGIKTIDSWWRLQRRLVGGVETAMIWDGGSVSNGEQLAKWWKVYTAYQEAWDQWWCKQGRHRGSDRVVMSLHPLPVVVVKHTRCVSKKLKIKEANYNWRGWSSTMSSDEGLDWRKRCIGWTRR